MFPFLVLFSAFCILFLDIGGLITPFHQKAYDAMLWLRMTARKHKQGNEKTLRSQPIVILEIDDNTLTQKEFQIPQTLWHSYYVQTIRALADAGARVIGFDLLLPQALFDDLVPGYSRTWLKALAYANVMKVPVIAGYVDLKHRQVFPHSLYLQLLGNQGVGLFNLTVDSDDFIRQQQILFSSKHSNEMIPCFSFLVASAYKNFNFYSKREAANHPGGKAKAQGEKTPLPQLIYIDYNPPDFFPRYSFAAIHKKIVMQDTDYLFQAFHDKIVLIGQTDSLSQDRHLTPLYYVSNTLNKRTPGIEINANVVHTLIDNERIKEFSPLGRFLVYLFTCGSVITATMGFRRRWILAHLVGITILHTALAAVAIIRYSYIFPMAAGGGAIIFSQLFSFGWRYYIVDWEKRKIESVFQCFLPREIVAKIVSQGEEKLLEGREKSLCIMFTDIRSFTSFSERKRPAEVVNRLNEYFEAMSSAVYSENGVVDKFLGDGIMAFFGAFDKNRDTSLASLAAARAALKMLDILDSLNEQWERQHQKPFRIGIGIHTGKVMIGNIGSRTKMEYTVIGDAVNLASRLQDQTKKLGETIIISESVQKDLAGKIVVENRGIVEIKGRSPVEIYGLKGLST
ncbi:MAG: adenylate/guanylate cyclase domain-containing protein [Thermodesulfobacteriota bacterium]|nr:adenylate/guanylate cyclase domain-containing protein [Thermodesulfobacteriota bacterium]